MRSPEYKKNVESTLIETLSQTPNLVRSLQELRITPSMDRIRDLLPSIRTISKTIGKSVIPTLLLSLSACSNVPSQVTIDNQQTTKLAQLEEENTTLFTKVTDLTTKLALLTESVLGKEKVDERTIATLRQELKAVTETTKTLSETKADKGTVTSLLQRTVNLHNENLGMKQELEQQRQTTDERIQSIDTRVTTTANELRTEVQEVANYNNAEHTKTRESLVRILDELPQHTQQLPEGLQEEVTNMQQRINILFEWFHNNIEYQSMVTTNTYEHINYLYQEVYRLNTTLQNTIITDIHNTDHIHMLLNHIFERIDTLEQTILTTPETPQE